MPENDPHFITCPVCDGQELQRDGSTPLLFFFAMLIPPFSWLLFLINKNVYCQQCGSRFRTDANWHHDLLRR